MNLPFARVNVRFIAIRLNRQRKMIEDEYWNKLEKHGVAVHRTLQSFGTYICPYVYNLVESSHVRVFWVSD